MFCIVPLSNGRVEDFEVITSVISMLSLRQKQGKRQKFTHAAIRQDSHEFIDDCMVKTATLKNGRKERPVDPRERISTLTIESSLI